MSIASEITRLQNAKSSIKTSIENKGVTVPSATTLDGYSTLIDSIPTSSSIVNGIIEQYKASTSTIDANTFVEFINDMTPSEDTQISSSTGSGTKAKSVLIDTNKVFIAYPSDSTNYYLRGIVCTISDGIITVGTEKVINSTSNSANYIGLDKIDTNKVFIAYPNGANKYLYGIVCTISGSTITIGTNTELSTNTNTGVEIDTASIDTNKVFITYQNGSTNKYLYGIVCTISGTTITKGTAKAINQSVGACVNSNVVKLDTDKVFIAHQRSNNYHTLYGIVCTVSGTTITIGTAKSIVDTTGSSDYISATFIDTDKVFIAHSSDSTKYYLNVIVCTISGTTITAGIDTQISTTKNTSYYCNVVKLDTNKVFIVHSNDDTNYYLNGTICTINGITITKESDTQLSSTTNSASYCNAVLLDSENIFISHGTTLKALIVELGKKIVTSTTKIEGLTKTQCTTSTAGDVWVLDI